MELPATIAKREGISLNFAQRKRDWETINLAIEGVIARYLI